MKYGWRSAPDLQCTKAGITRWHWTTGHRPRRCAPRANSARLLTAGSVRVPSLSPDVALGMLFIALTVFSCILWWRTLFQHRWLLWVFVFAVIRPVISNQAGWAATSGTAAMDRLGPAAARRRRLPATGANVLTCIIVFV